MSWSNSLSVFIRKIWIILWLRQYQIWFLKETKTKHNSNSNAISSRLKCASKLEFGYVFELHIVELGMAEGWGLLTTWWSMAMTNLRHDSQCLETSAFASYSSTIIIIIFGSGFFFSFRCTSSSVETFLNGGEGAYSILWLIDGLPFYKDNGPKQKFNSTQSVLYYTIICYSMVVV